MAVKGQTSQSEHSRTFWAPSAVRRIKAVRSELTTIANLRAQRGLSASEALYYEHLVRREAELEAELLDEAKARATNQRL
ncbi:MAG: hypothetical protein JF603_13495 [Acidobacteria bacterium]|nr:hypothetical protein [Acidobacteriota bacterium]